jgi:16S rRNA (adenine1518-N6/adenine1519-N6)-dimethyltransferase
MPTSGQPEYLGANDIRELAQSLGLRPTKTLGQNFVHDANTVRKIVDQAGVTPGSHVLEIGPGLGSLTLGLAHAGARVTAWEIDPLLADQLPVTLAHHGVGDQVTVITGDAMQLVDVPQDVSALVANLPYNVSVPVLINVLQNAPWMSRVLVMVQAEVGHRIAAQPGSKAYGTPSVKLAWWGNWRVEAPISKRVFWPEPRVDSVLVGMVAHDPPGDDALRQRVFELVDAGFGQRRKMARQALGQFFGGVEEASAAMTQAGLRPTDRCEEWGLADFVALAARSTT